VKPNAKNIFGYDTLIGMQQLMLFEIDSKFSPGGTQVLQNGESIDKEAALGRHSHASMRVLEAERS